MYRYNLASKYLHPRPRPICFIHRDIAEHCPRLVAASSWFYVEGRTTIVWQQSNNNPEKDQYEGFNRLTRRIFLSECDWGSLAKSIETWPCGAPACQTSKRAVKCKLFGTRPSALHRSCAPEIQTWVCEGFSMWHTDICLPQTRPQFPLPRTVPRYNSLPQRFREHIYC